MSPMVRGWDTVKANVPDRRRCGLEGQTVREA